MPQVVNQLLPVPPARTVTARLMASVGWYSNGSGGFTEAVTAWTTEIGDDGNWSLTLPANDTFDAPDTWYRIDQPGASHACVVPDGDGPYLLHSIEIVDPAAPSCCPPPPAGATSDLGPLTARVDVHENRLDAVEPRVTSLEVAADSANSRLISQDGRITALEVSGFGALDYQHYQSSPAFLVQIVHNLPFRPSGVICTESGGDQVFWSTKTDPLPGVTEVTFGFAFAGQIDLS